MCYRVSDSLSKRLKLAEAIFDDISISKTSSNRNSNNSPDFKLQIYFIYFSRIRSRNLDIIEKSLQLDRGCKYAAKFFVDISTSKKLEQILIENIEFVRSL